MGKTYGVDRITPLERRYMEAWARVASWPFRTRVSILYFAACKQFDWIEDRQPNPDGFVSFVENELDLFMADPTNYPLVSVGS